MKDTPLRETRTRSKGFTLIEIMIVIAVLGILTMVTAPKYQAVIGHYHLEQSAQTIAAQLRLAKQVAMDQRKEVFVVFRTDSISIYTTSIASENLYTQPVYLERGTEFVAPNVSAPELGSRGLYEIPEYYLEYDPRGFLHANPNDRTLPEDFAAQVRVKYLATNEVATVNLRVGTGYITIS